MTNVQPFGLKPNIPRTKISKNLPVAIKEGLITFAVANSTFLVLSQLIGLTIGRSTTSIVINGSEEFILELLLQPDFLFLYLALLQLSFFNIAVTFTSGTNIFRIFALFGGWLVAGIFVRYYYPSSGVRPLIFGTQTLSVILGIILSLNIFPLLLSAGAFGNLTGINILLLLLQIIIILPLD